MADLREQPRLIRVTDDTTADELAETIGLLNGEAKRLSRMGLIGTRTEAYAANHRRIDALLDELEAKRASA